MTKVTTDLHSFNAGEASAAALARVDQEQLRLAAEREENLFPYVIGKAIMRPGTRYVNRLNLQPDTGQVIAIPFARSSTQTALIELSANTATQKMWMRVVGTNDSLVSYPAVTCSVYPATASTGWSTVITGDAVANFDANGCALYAPSNGSRVILKQTFTTSSIGTLHALRIKIGGQHSNTMKFRCGSTDGAYDLFGISDLGVGVHSLAFTPAAATFYIQFEYAATQPLSVVSIAFQSAGEMVLPVPFTDMPADYDLTKVRHTQSLDEIFVALSDTQQVILQHRGPNSWSACSYYADDGPFLVSQFDPTICLTPSATSGYSTISASANFFTDDMVGELLQITHASMAASFGITGADVYTPPFRVVGVQASGDRGWNAVISGTWAGTIICERSYDDQFSGFNAYATAGSITVNGTLSVDDADDNSITWYRLKFSAYTSGTANIKITYGGYGYSGACRIVSVASSTSASSVVVSPFANTLPTNLWLEGDWSPKRGYPTATTLFDGRLWWARDDQFWGSVSDDYFSYAVSMSAKTTTSGTTVVGDSSSIQRRIATGGSYDDVVFMLPLQRLIFGTSGAEVSARTSSLDEPLTPTNITLRDASSQGAAQASPVKIDKRGIFIQRSTHKLYALSYDVYSQDYNGDNLMRLNEDIGYPTDPAYTTGFTQIMVQRQPETYIWGVRSDGVCCNLLYEPAEKVMGWFRVTTGRHDAANMDTLDRVTWMAGLPSEGEDIVYMLTQRTAGGQTYAYLERFVSHYDTLTREWDAATQTQTTAPGIYQADCHIQVTPSGGGNLTLTGLSHLEGRTVIALGYSAARQSYGPLLSSNGTPYYTVSGGSITLGEPADTSKTPEITVGLPYTGYYKSAKLAYGAPQGQTALLKKKKVASAGLLAQDTHPDALLIGCDFDGIETMDPLPRIEDLQPVQTTGTLQRVHDKATFPIANVWDTDARICVQVNPGYSATLSGLVVSVESGDGD